MAGSMARKRSCQGDVIRRGRETLQIIGLSPFKLGPPVPGGRVEKHAPPRTREADERRNLSKNFAIAAPILGRWARRGGGQPVEYRKTPSTLA